ncbi:N-acetyltransferase family protein [Haloferacaceae archaeon DSL9]
MTRERLFPDAPSGPFEAPPQTFADRNDTEITIRAYDGSEDDFEALVEMYDAFDPADRAQGIPPGQEHRIRTWLETILADDCLNVIAWDGETAAGHATLVPDDEAYELAIFVLQAYQEAGIGTSLIRALLGHGAANGVDKVWLTVERWNRAAVGLYKKVGFETSDAESFELEMAIRLADD